MQRNIIHSFVSDNSRSGRLKKNVAASFFIKGWAGVVQLLLVPVTLLCLGTYNNGLWMIVVSLLLWIDNMDLGMGNGLRNKVAEYIAKNDIEKTRCCISTAFFAIFFLMLAIAVIMSVIIYFVDINALLNIDTRHCLEFKDILILSFFVTCVTFIFKLTGNVYLAMQLPAVNNAIVVTGQSAVLLGMYVLWFFGISSLWAVAIVYTVIPLLVNIIAFCLTFWFKYPHLKPSLQGFKKQEVKEILTLGSKFFLLQVSSIVIFMTTNLIISSLFTPEHVTPYQVAYRLFTFLLSLFMVVLTPYWSSTTDAYNRHDYDWIVQSQKRMLRLLYLIALCFVVVVLLSEYIYKVWIVDQVQVPMSLSICMAIYIYELIFSQTYSYFLNGIGALKMQLWFTLFAAIMVVPLSVFLGHKFGLDGICIALIVVNLPGAIANKYKFDKVFRELKSK